MIKKPRTKPLKLLKLDSIIQRLIPSHPKYGELKTEFTKYAAGYRGEVALDYYLHDLDENSYLIFHDLRLPRDKEKKYYFQIDCLILHSSFGVLLEVKNLSGDLYFDHHFDQMKRTKNGVDETFPDPVNQVQQQKIYLESWLTRNQLPKIPLDSLVVLTNPKSFITLSPHYGKKAAHIIRAKGLANKIQDISTSHQEILSKKDLSKLTTKLLKQHEKHNPDVLRTYNIKETDIHTGVFCPDCNHIPMRRERSTWVCSKCNVKSKEAHIRAILDYALIFDHPVKNKTLRRFLHIDSSTCMKNLLKSINLTPSGPTNSATYQLPIPE
ncbi:MAG: nuclease-related domain-containing protein [Bacillota bacterium]|uniref:nuclease-related domain-containing protein n=1 Tax=Fictibacillus sp. 18YEL24 TaxID=2745875 RepID=UPI0018CE8ABF|nr:nuclease-related domain-containing protein [Fictibacillus sp. 18YEL24]MBH0167940.1 NERD domain-containing protein [Fictibacillus sp. 18YEL24]